MFDYNTVTSAMCPVVKVVWREHESDADEVVLLEVMIHPSDKGGANVLAAEQIALALTDWLEGLMEVIPNENRNAARRALLYTIYPPTT